MEAVRLKVSETCSTDPTGRAFCSLRLVDYLAHRILTGAGGVPERTEHSGPDSARRCRKSAGCPASWWLSRNKNCGCFARTPKRKDGIP